MALTLFWSVITSTRRPGQKISPRIGQVCERPILLLVAGCIAAAGLKGRMSRDGRKWTWGNQSRATGVRSALMVSNRSRGLMAYEATPGRTSALRPRVLRASAYVGLLVSGALVFFLPWLLTSQFSLKVAPAWGLGDFAFAFCAAGALIGMLIDRRMKL